jgi:hypothetical protein
MSRATVPPDPAQVASDRFRNPQDVVAKQWLRHKLDAGMFEVLNQRI